MTRLTSLTVALSAFLALCLAAISTATPIDTHTLDRRAGPSGQVITPSGGTTFYAYYNYPSAKIHLVYKPVLQYSPPDCRDFACTSETYYISVFLTNSANSYPLAGLLARPSNGGNIDAYLTAPTSVCGDYRITIRETALYNGQRVEFQSAAPLITIYCSILTTKRDGIASAEDAPSALEKRDDGGVAMDALVERNEDGTSLMARQDPGPSGQVIAPAGGTWINIDRGYPSASIHFVYSTVYQRVTGNCSYCTAETLYVEVRLVPINNDGLTANIANFLTTSARGVNIDTYLGAPRDFCGDYRLVVYETQLLRGSLITFKSAAPAIFLNCVRLG